MGRLVLLGTLTAAAADDSLLKSLPSEYARAPWRSFYKAQKELVASSKEVTSVASGSADAGGEGEGAASPKAVVKVVARAKLPVRALLDTFESEDEAIISEWNPYAGEVQHLDRAAHVMLQIYSMPWPFASREYLVRCEEKKFGNGGGHQAYCASIDAHPSAPLRSDRVRGVSETVWRFVEEKDGHTSIHLETLVDPRGGLPTWVVDKVGKSAAVKIVKSLISYTSDRVARAKGKALQQQHQQMQQQMEQMQVQMPAPPQQQQKKQYSWGRGGRVRRGDAPTGGAADASCDEAAAGLGGWWQTFTTAATSPWTPWGAFSAFFS